MPGQPAVMTWDDLDALPQAAPDETVRYGSEPLQVADLWLPKGAGPHRVVLMVHGGCWQSKIADRTIMNRIAGNLRGRGIAVWNIDYRGVDLTGNGHALLRDAATATDALRATAATHTLDLSRLVAIGHSAGGHIALWLAARPKIDPILSGTDPLPIHHVVSLGGLPDLEQARAEPTGCGPDIIGELIGEAIVDVADLDLYADMSIPRLAPLGVPQTVINGDADKIIPTHFAADYAAKMRAKGDAVEVRIVPGAGHVELIAPGTTAWTEAVAAIERALDR